MTLNMTVKHGFLAALVVAVRLKTDYKRVNSNFYEYSE